MAKQSETTNLCSELVKVLYEDASRSTRSTLANLEQISSNYAILLSDARLQAGQPIAFEAQGHDLYGTVDSVETDRTLGCFTTVKLDANSRWNGRMFVPEHFLALCAFTHEIGFDAEAARPSKAFTLSKRSGS